VFWCLASNQVLLFQKKLQCHKFYKLFDFADSCHMTDRQTDKQTETWTISALLKRGIKLRRTRPTFSADIPLKKLTQCNVKCGLFLLLSGTFGCDEDTQKCGQWLSITTVLDLFDVQGDRASWEILIIKPTRCTNFSNLFLELNSACFGEFLCPSSGDFHCTHSKPVRHIPLLCVQWKTPDVGQWNCPKHVEFYSKISLRN
jgi:hypothetical protein